MAQQYVRKDEQIAAVVLAAGLSSRMGEFKPLLPFKARTVIEQVVDTALQVAQRVLVVVGFQKEQIIHLRHWSDRVVFVVNENYFKGMFSSVKAGVAQVQEPRFFIVLADQPQIPVTVYQQLLAARQADVILPIHQGRRGHPVLLNRVVREAILLADENDPAVNLKNIISRFSIQEVNVELPAIHGDMDTPEDYQRILDEENF